MTTSALSAVGGRTWPTCATTPDARWRARERRRKTRRDVGSASALRTPGMDRRVAGGPRTLGRAHARTPHAATPHAPRDIVYGVLYRDAHRHNSTNYRLYIIYLYTRHIFCLALCRALSPLSLAVARGRAFSRRSRRGSRRRERYTVRGSTPQDHKAHDFPSRRA